MAVLADVLKVFLTFTDMYATQRNRTMENLDIMCLLEEAHHAESTLSSPSETK